jgi:hypothetical protein
MFTWVQTEITQWTTRARLHGGIRNKAARGELRTALPVGLVWDEADGVGLHPDEAADAPDRQLVPARRESAPRRR